MIGGAISQVYYQRAAAHRTDNQKLRRESLRILVATALGALLLLVLLLAIPDAAYSFAFGAAWNGVGDYLRILSPWMLASFVAIPLSVLFLVKEKFALHFYFALSGSVLAVAILGISKSVFDSVLLSMAALSIGMTAYIALAIVAEFWIVVGRDSKGA